MDWIGIISSQIALTLKSLSVLIYRHCVLTSSFFLVCVGLGKRLYPPKAEVRLRKGRRGNGSLIIQIQEEEAHTHRRGQTQAHQKSLVPIMILIYQLSFFFSFFHSFPYSSLSLGFCTLFLLSNFFSFLYCNCNCNCGGGSFKKIAKMQVFIHTYTYLVLFWYLSYCLYLSCPCNSKERKWGV